MTIKYYRGIERDGLVFLCDKEGKELMQVVDKDRSYDQRTQAILHFNVTVGDLDDKLDAAWNAMLYAAKVDVSAALVKVPGRRKPTMKNWGDAEMRGWNACLDELERS